MEEEIQNVTEEVTENTDAQTVEENEESIELTDTAEVEETSESTEEKEEDSKPQGRFVTDEELNEIVDKRVRRKLDKLEREQAKQLADYRDTEAVLNAGLGTNNIQEANQRMREYYENEGIKMPERIVPGHSKHEIEVLAKDEANGFIEDGHDAMLNEANRLAQIGYANMSDREKIIFTTLSERLTEEKDKEELKRLGADESLLTDKKWIEHRNQFNSNVPIEKIYALYKGIQPKAKVENPGSMKNTPATNNIKDFYTYEEASKFTKEDFDKNPELFKVVENSSYKW